MFFLLFNFIYGCTQIRESAGVGRKTPDEFQVIESPPLVIPPTYNLVPPDQLQAKNIQNIEEELAEEILFGLEEENDLEKNQLSTMNQILLNANASEVSNTIRDEINENFAKEMSATGGFQIIWKDEKEVLDAVKESERIREKIFNNESIEEGDLHIKKQKVKRKKRKRFFFF